MTFLVHKSKSSKNNCSNLLLTIEHERWDVALSLTLAASCHRHVIVIASSLALITAETDTMTMILSSHLTAEERSSLFTTSQSLYRWCWLWAGGGAGEDTN